MAPTICELLGPSDFKAFHHLNSTAYDATMADQIPQPDGSSFSKGEIVKSKIILTITRRFKETPLSRAIPFSDEAIQSFLSSLSGRLEIAKVALSLLGDMNDSKIDPRIKGLNFVEFAEVGMKLMKKSKCQSALNGLKEYFVNCCPGASRFEAFCFTVVCIPCKIVMYPVVTASLVYSSYSSSIVNDMRRLTHNDDAELGRLEKQFYRRDTVFLNNAVVPYPPEFSQEQVLSLKSVGQELYDIQSRQCMTNDSLYIYTKGPQTIQFAA